MKKALNAAIVAAPLLGASFLLAPVAHAVVSGTYTWHHQGWSSGCPDSGSPADTSATVTTNGSSMTIEVADAMGGTDTFTGTVSGNSYSLTWTNDPVVPQPTLAGVFPNGTLSPVGTEGACSEQITFIQ